MTDHSPERLRALLACSPSVDGWLELCRLVIMWPATAGAVPVAEVDAALAHWPFELRRLHSDWSQFGYGGEAGPLGRLARWVSIDHRSDDANRHLARIAASLDLEKLQRLTISHSEIDVHGLNALASATGLTWLRELELDALCIGIDALAKLAGASLLSQLSSLRITGCDLDGSKLVEWILSTRLVRLENLDLRGNRLCDADVEVLSRGSRFPALRVLDLSRNPLSEEGRALLRHRWNRAGGLTT